MAPTLTHPPARTPYKFSTKSNAKKEIYEWAVVEMNAADGMRGAGQLTENVTEARMLKGKMMELSRERYKFKTQAEFEKKFFLEGQVRKTKRMPDLMRSVDVQHWVSQKNKMQQKVGQGPIRRETEEEEGSQGTEPTKMTAPLNPPNSLATDAVQLSVGPTHPAPQCRKSVADPVTAGASVAETSGGPEDADNMLGGPNIFPTQVSRLSARTSVQLAPYAGIAEQEDGGTPPSGFLPKMAQQRSSSTQCFVPSGSLRGGADGNKSKRRIRSSLALLMPKQVSQDRRFVNLRMTLSQNYEVGGGETGEVSDVISSIDALCMGSKSSQYTKPKLNAKIIEFMRSKGIFKR